MTHYANPTPHFLFLCDRDQIEDILDSVNTNQFNCRFVHSVEELLACCLGEPPLAAIIDLPVLSRFDSTTVDAILNLGVCWPVMRLAAQQNEKHWVMSLQPRKSLPLGQAMYEIAAGNSDWKNPIYDRKFLRMDVLCRVRLRATNDTVWHPGNTFDIGVGGSYVITYDQWIEGEDIEIELLDIVDEPVQLRGRVVRVCDWNESAGFPGIALSFATATIPQRLITAIAKPEYINSMSRQLVATTPLR